MRRRLPKNTRLRESEARMGQHVNTSVWRGQMKGKHDGGNYWQRVA